MNTVKDVALESGMCQKGIKDRMQILGISGPLLTDEETEAVINYKRPKGGGSQWGYTGNVK